MIEVFVSYVNIVKNKKIGVGNISIETSASLPLSYEEIREIEEGIAKMFKYKQVVLLNYFPLGKKEGADNG